MRDDGPLGTERHASSQFPFFKITANTTLCLPIFYSINDINVSQFLGFDFYNLKLQKDNGNLFFKSVLAKTGSTTFNNLLANKKSSRSNTQYKSN